MPGSFQRRQSDSGADLESLTKAYSHIRLASEEDNEEILSFLRAQEMKAGKLELDFDRGSDFFAFCRLHSDNFFVFVFLNDDGSIGGLGSLLRKHRWQAGQLAPVGYLCDLRISPKASRMTHVQWRKFFADLAAHLPEAGPDERCSELFTAIFNDNEKALRSLTSKLKEVRYEPAGLYNSYIFFAKKPFRRNKVADCYTCELASKPEGLEDFLAKEVSSLRWAPDFRDPVASELSFRSQSWKGWEDHSWIALRDAQGEIIACAKPWVDPEYRRLSVRSAPASVVQMAQSCRFLGRPKPELGQALRVLSIPFFVVKSSLEKNQRKQVAEALMATLWSQGWHKDCHFVQWTSPPRDTELAQAVAKDYFSTQKGGYLFRVSSTRMGLGSLKQPESFQPFFESAL